MQRSAIARKKKSILWWRTRNRHTNWWCDTLQPARYSQRECVSIKCATLCWQEMLSHCRKLAEVMQQNSKTTRCTLPSHNQTLILLYISLVFDDRQNQSEWIASYDNEYSCHEWCDPCRRHITLDMDERIVVLWASLEFNNYYLNTIVCRRNASTGNIDSLCIIIIWFVQWIR